MSKYNLNPKNIPDLKWKLSTTLNTKSKTIQIKEEIPDKNTIGFSNNLKTFYFSRRNTQYKRIINFYLKRGGEDYWWNTKGDPKILKRFKKQGC